MRLLRVRGGFSLVEYNGKDIPPYAILSHTWGDDSEEVTFDDMEKKTGSDKKGFQKLLFCREQAISNGLEFIWVDTCCINKSSSAELSEAINSMFAWYQKAAECYVYLSDVVVKPPSTVLENLGIPRKPSFQRSWSSSFLKSRWFTRGWTLQELLAPASVEFFAADRQRLGSKISLVKEIHEATGISIQAIRGGDLSQIIVSERLSWAERRETKREEDAAYCLLGIFDIHMPLIYGEGQKKAFDRLQRKIAKSSTLQVHRVQTPPAQPDPEWRPQRQRGSWPKPMTNNASAELKLNEDKESTIPWDIYAKQDLPRDKDTQSSRQIQSPNLPQSQNGDLAHQDPGGFVPLIGQCTIWKISKRPRDTWEQALIQQLFVAPQLIEDELERFRATNYNVSKILGTIWPDNARSVLDRFLVKQNLDLGRVALHVRWAIASIRLDWKFAADKTWQELVAMTIVLEIEQF